MILIPEHPIFTRNDEGQQCSFDLRRFNDDMREAFHRNGVQDAWLIDQFQLLIEEKLRAETMRSTPLSEQEIDTLMTSVLTSSGYSDVASAYAELRGTNPLRGLQSELARWDESRLEQTLTRRLPVTSREVAKLVPLCSEALKQLNISTVSDEFIAELAIHLAHDGNKPLPLSHAPSHDINEAPAPHKDAMPMESPAQMAETASPFLRRLIEEHVVRILPAAILFPKAQVGLSLQDFCRVFMDGWPSELAFASFIGPVADAVLELLDSYRKKLAKAYPNLADSDSQVIVIHYDAFIEQTFGPSSKTGRLAFNQAIRDLLETTLVKRAPFELTLKFR